MNRKDIPVTMTNIVNCVNSQLQLTKFDKNNLLSNNDILNTSSSAKISAYSADLKLISQDSSSINVSKYNVYLKQLIKSIFSTPLTEIDLKLINSTANELSQKEDLKVEDLYSDIGLNR